MTAWNINYGAFSKVHFESEYDSHKHLIENPEQMETDSFMLFSYAIWFYMRTESPLPSMHDVAAGFYIEREADL